MVYGIAPTAAAQEGFSDRLRQQTAIAVLAQRALDPDHRASLASDAAALAADGLGVDRCIVFELSTDGATLIPSADSRSLPHPPSHDSAVNSALSAQASYTLRTDGPVVVTDLRRETRFPLPRAIADLGAINCASVVIRSRQRVFGVLCAQAAAPRTFDVLDIHFLETMAQILGQALEHRRVEEEQMRKLSRALEQSADFVVITDSNGLIEYVNPAFEQKTGYRREELAGRTPSVVRSGLHDADFYSRLWETILRGDVYRNVVVNRTRSGELYYEEKTITPLKDGQGRITHFISTGKDITDRKRAEEEVQRHRADLAHVARLATMGEMAAGLAHELNQPISAIANYAHGCLRRMQTGRLSADDDLLHALEQVRHQAERAGAIIHRMRDFARKGQMRRVPADINALVREVMQLAEPDARRHGAKVRLALAQGLPPALADPIQIEQVLLNLILNGLEVMQAIDPAHRQLTISTEAVDAQTLRISVTDVGPGLPTGVGEQIFAPFFTTKQDGVGMGLSISRTIVEAHGGTLQASSTPMGTTFQFTLPVDHGDAGSAPVSA